MLWEKPIQSVGLTGERVWARAEGGQTGGGWKERSRDAFLSSHGKLLDERTEIKVCLILYSHFLFILGLGEKKLFMSSAPPLSLISVFFSLCQTQKHKGMDG